MKHYFYPVSRGATTAWMLKELDVPHEEIVIDFRAGDQNSPEYVAINPMRKVPALVEKRRVMARRAEHVVSRQALHVRTARPKGPRGAGQLAQLPEPQVTTI